MSIPTVADSRTALRTRTEEVCKHFPDDYWRESDQARRYPTEFVDAMGESGLLAVMIPTEYGGGGYGKVGS